MPGGRLRADRGRGAGHRALLPHVQGGRVLHQADAACLLGQPGEVGRVAERDAHAEPGQDGLHADLGGDVHLREGDAPGQGAGLTGRQPGGHRAQGRGGGQRAAGRTRGRQQRFHPQLAAAVRKPDRGPAVRGDRLVRAADHELSGDLAPPGGRERPRAGLLRIERRGPRGVQVERVGQHPADLVVQGARAQQLRDLVPGRGRDRLVDLLPGQFGILQQRRLRQAGAVAGGDGVQVGTFGPESRVGPDLIAGVQGHARTTQRGAARPTGPAGPPAAPGRPRPAGAARRPWPARSRARAPRYAMPSPLARLDGDSTRLARGSLRHTAPSTSRPKAASAVP